MQSDPLMICNVRHILKATSQLSTHARDGDQFSVDFRNFVHNDTNENVDRKHLQLFTAYRKCATFSTIVIKILKSPIQLDLWDINHYRRAHMRMKDPVETIKNINGRETFFAYEWHSTE